MLNDFEISFRKLSNTLRLIEERLKAGDFRGLEEISDGRRLTASEMERAVREYRHKVAGLAVADIIVVPVVDSDPQEWSVDVPIRDVDGVGDLTLSLFLADRADRDDVYRIEVADIHVL